MVNDGVRDDDDETHTLTSRLVAAENSSKKMVLNFYKIMNEIINVIPKDS